MSATQLKKYIEQENALNETLQKAKVADNVDSKNRKRKCEAKSRQAQKKVRIGKAGGMCYPFRAPNFQFEVFPGAPSTFTWTIGLLAGSKRSDCKNV